MDTASIAPEVVKTGSEVEIELLGSGEPEQLILTIVPDTQADFYQGYLGESTPLAKALLGHAAGESVVYQVGEFHQASILEIRIVDQRVKEARQNARHRQEEIDKTRRQIDRTNAMIFSSTVEGKWGEYDTDGIEDW
jgi:hypothetical protein